MRDDLNLTTWSWTIDNCECLGGSCHEAYITVLVIEYQKFRQGEISWSCGSYVSHQVRLKHLSIQVAWLGCKPTQT